MQRTEVEKKKHKKLKGEHNYDILTNPFYADRYSYTPCIFPNRSKYAISQFKSRELRKSSLDLVRVVCDLPYLPDKRAKEMDFNVLYLALERQIHIDRDGRGEKQDNEKTLE